MVMIGLSVAVVVLAATGKVDTAEGMLAKARRVVMPLVDSRPASTVADSVRIAVHHY